MWKGIFVFFSFLHLCEGSDWATHQLERLYCGQQNCYEILELNSSASSVDVKKAYRRLSRKYHPDRNHEEDASENFRRIAKAYDVLLNADSRAAYDFYTSHPDSLYALYYGMRVVYPAQTHPAVVLVGVLVFVSILQIVNSQYSYRRVANTIKRTNKFKTAVDEVLRERYKGRFKSLPVKEKEQRRFEVERELLVERVHVQGAALQEGIDWRGLAVMSVITIPFYLVSWIVWNIKWWWRHSVRSLPYGYEEEVYLSRRTIGISAHEWEAIDESKKEELLGRKVWVGDNWKVLQQEQKEEEREKLAGSARYRQQKRFEKKLQRR